MSEGRRDDMELITISMPVYNVEQYVKKALLSALNQSYYNLEFIIVDDKGTDNSIEIVKEIAINHPRGKYVRIIEHKFNRGTGATKNTAIINAKGKYLYFMDSDDEISPDCIRKLYDEIFKSSVDVVCGSYQKITPTGLIDCSMNRNVETDSESIILSYFDGRFPVYTWNKLYNLDFLRKFSILCVDNQTIEDNYFTFQVLLYARSYSVIPDITYFYKLRSSSTTNANKWSLKVYEQWDNIFNDQISLLEKQILSESLKRKIYKKLFWQRVSVSERLICDLPDNKKYINSYLDMPLISNFQDNSIILFLAYLLSKSPYWIKKIFLKLHMSLYSL